MLSTTIIGVTRQTRCSTSSRTKGRRSPWAIWQLKERADFVWPGHRERAESVGPRLLVGSRLEFNRTMLDDAVKAKVTGSGGHEGNDSDSSAAGSQPQNQLFG